MIQKICRTCGGEIYFVGGKWGHTVGVLGHDPLPPPVISRAANRKEPDGRLAVITVRMSPAMHAKLKAAAITAGVSLNTFCIDALGSKLGFKCD